MDVVRPEAQEALEALEELVRTMRAFLPARPPEDLVMEFRLLTAAVVGGLGGRREGATDGH